MFNLTRNLIFAYPLKTLRGHGKQHGNVEVLGLVWFVSVLICATCLKR